MENFLSKGFLSPNYLLKRDGGGVPPPSPPLAPPEFADLSAETEEDEEGDDEDDNDEEVPPRSRLHSSLWPARHAARWQAWLQYFRCRHPEHFCSDRSVAGSPQKAHSSVMVRASPQIDFRSPLSLLIKECGR